MDGEASVVKSLDGLEFEVDSGVVESVVKSVVTSS